MCCVVSAEEKPVEFAEDKAVVSAEDKAGVSAEKKPLACQEIPMAWTKQPLRGCEVHGIGIYLQVTGLSSADTPALSSADTCRHNSFVLCKFDSFLFCRQVMGVVYLATSFFFQEKVRF